MRGFLHPAHHILPSEAQRDFRAMSRHRRSRLARDAHVTLVKADQWGRGGTIASDEASALEAGVKALSALKK
jgi:hypothetical protein